CRSASGGGSVVVVVVEPAAAARFVVVDAVATLPPLAAELAFAASSVVFVAPAHRPAAAAEARAVAARATRTRARPAEARPTGARSRWTPVLGLGDAHLPPLDLDAVHRIHRGLRRLVGVEVDERETARAAGVAIEDDARTRHFEALALECCQERGVVDLVGQVAHEQTLAHSREGSLGGAQDSAPRRRGDKGNGVKTASAGCRSRFRGPWREVRVRR